jgi:hypothetical protein
MKNICISGDSWACGEWDIINGVHCVSHKGIDEYLSTNNSLINCGRRGVSLNETLYFLKQQVIKTQFDYIFLFQTDPLRNLRPYNFLKNNTIVTFEMLLEYHYQELASFYSSLNSLGVTIHLIGGCSKVEKSLIQNYNNLVPYIESFIELLLPEYKHPKLWFSDWGKLIDRQFSLECLDKLSATKKIQDALIKEKKFFYPDGLHPNRLAHKILFDKICVDFKLK